MAVRRSPADMELDDLHDQPQTPRSNSPVQSITRSEPVPKAPTSGNTLRIAPSPEIADQAEHHGDQNELIDTGSGDQASEAPPVGGKSSAGSKKPAAKKVSAKKPAAKKTGPKSSTAKLAPVASVKSQPWIAHRISESDWNSLPIYELPITTDEDAIKAGLLPNHFQREYDAIMSHQNESLWKKEWKTLAGETFRTIDLAVNDIDLKYRTPEDGVICAMAPQLWTIYPLSHTIELDKIKLITFDQKQKDVEALVLNYDQENKKLRLGLDYQTIHRNANQQYQSLINYLLFRERKHAEIQLAEQKNIQKRERVISKASPLLALAPSLAKWVAKNGKPGEKK